MEQALQRGYAEVVPQSINGDIRVRTVKGDVAAAADVVWKIDNAQLLWLNNKNWLLLAL